MSRPKNSFGEPNLGEDVYAYSEVKEGIAEGIRESLRKRGIEVSKEEILRQIVKPPSPDFGDLGIGLFRYAKALKVKPQALAEEIAKEVDHDLIREKKVIGGYLNFFLDITKLAKRVLEEALDKDYGRWDIGEGKVRVVEHTSANPVHPLHIGHTRNMFLGDSLVRILRNAGWAVQSRFYINDMGRQVAILVYGIMKLNAEPPEGEKPDHWYGKVYSVSNTLVELSKAIREGNEEEAKEWQEVLEELEKKWPEIVKALKDKITPQEDHEKAISELMKRYEEGDEEIKKIFRKVVNDVLKGFRETMEKVNVDVDVWDWESDLVWSGLVKKIIEEAKEKGLLKEHKGALAIDFTPFLNDEVRKKLRIPKGLEIPPLILVRSDGTTLYTTRDIAYTIKKFEETNAEKVINVIASEQRLPQIQLRLALWALGYRRYAENLIHYAYEMVTIPGMKMSGRRGRMITLDWLIDEARRRVKELVKERSEARDVEKVINAVAVGALKYALVSVSAEKPITFKWEDVLNFNRNSAPYLQYTHARAVGILRKGGRGDLNKASFEKAEKYKELIMKIAEFPEITKTAALDLAPERIAVYLNSLADSFNEFYHKEPVAKEPDEGLRNLKLLLVEAIANVMKKGLELLGIEAPERM